MGNKVDPVSTINQLLTKIDSEHFQRLGSLIPELTSVNELLGHNAQTAYDQINDQIKSILSALSDDQKTMIIEALPRINSEAVSIAERLSQYRGSNEVLLCLHLDDLCHRDNDLPELNEDQALALRRFLNANPNTHLVLLSHDSADVTGVLAGALVGSTPLSNNQISLVYESGLGLYLASGSGKEKKQYLDQTRGELLTIMERMALIAATKTQDQEFQRRFYFAATEYSIGIRVHPFARSKNTNLDTEAAASLISVLATAMADLVKEDMAAVEDHVINYFLKADSSLEKIFAKRPDERLWDIERVDKLLGMLELIHYGSLGSVIRPAEVTDVPAVQAVCEARGGRYLLVASANSHLTLPLLQWVVGQPESLIACSEQAEPVVKQLVETRGGLEFAADRPSELFAVLDAYLLLRKLKQ